MELEGTLSINRRSDGKIIIEVGDYVSGVGIVKVTLTAEQFGDAISGLYLGAGRTAAVSFNDTGARFFGCKLEHKTVIMDPPEIIPRDRAERDAGFDSMCEPYEVDGWRLNRDDLTNHHRRTDNGKQRVSAFRYVDADGWPVRREA